MAKKNKIAKRRKEIHGEFRERLLKYEELLSKIEGDYSAGIRIPSLPVFDLDRGQDTNLWQWAQKETLAKHIKELERRQKLIVQLKDEIVHILETSSLPDPVNRDYVVPSQFKWD